MTTLKKGWNMISNPYNYALPLGQLIAVVEDSPATPLTWAELVQQGFVAGAMIEWDRDPNDPNTGQYKFFTDINSQLQPHKGYWVFVQSFRAVHLSWPPVYHPGMPGSGRSTMDERWEQSNRNWRLQLAARNSDGMDAAAYVGVVADRKAVDSKSMPKPPMSPTAPVEIAVMGSYAGEPMKMSQALTDRSKKSEWKVLVRSESSGDVTVTWPNLPSIPKNVRMKVSDDAAGISQDMRNSSGYTFRMAEPGTRELTVSMELGGAVRPMIGNVIVTRPSRDGNSPISINYALSADATVSVRVLSSTGKEVFTITRGRAVNAGENNVTWMLRDNANRAVAPGTYRVEILAESPDGERVRKIVPVNVIR
jgi:hypothetical protein